MEGYKVQHEVARQEYFQMREKNDSCTQSLQRKEAEMRWILRQMREVAFRARVMANKTEELRREILPRDELSERLIDHLRMVRDQYDKVGNDVIGYFSSMDVDFLMKRTLHRYNTRARSKIMGDEHSERMDKIEKKQEEIMGQLEESGGDFWCTRRCSIDRSQYKPCISTKIHTTTSKECVNPYGIDRTISILWEVSAYRATTDLCLTEANWKDPISVLNLNDPKEQEKLKCGSVESKDNPDTHKKFNLLEERLRMVERMGMYCFMDAIELCLVLDVVITLKFKVSDFEKYDGTKCPVTHITMYCRRMAAYAHDDKLLIHYFQDNLTGAVAKWYVQLDHNRIHTWKDLARAFVAQYKHVIDMALDRLSLQNMEKKPTENFKEYA
ncbi:Retrotransposon gag domain - like 10 [Theobroma cacao]|nr:Retrotransposon gag domain - like 10 [Theobroma cacao]